MSAERIDKGMGDNWRPWSRAVGLAPHRRVSKRAEQLFRDDIDAYRRRVDLLLVGLIVLQWIAALIAAFYLSPYTWEGSQYSTHIHVKAALFLGGLITLAPCVLVRIHPGEPITRHVIAVAQVSFSALLIHLTAGRIETHFHIFGSLAFLAFYLDWRILVTGTVVVAFDHFFRGYYFPESVYGVPIVQPWRWLEHTAWVLFEDVFLVIGALRGHSLLRRMALRQAELEYNLAQLGGIVEGVPGAVLFIDPEGRILFSNEEIELYVQPGEWGIAGQVYESVLVADIVENLRSNLAKGLSFREYVLREDRSLLHMSGSPLRFGTLSQDAELGMVVHIEDVSYLRKLDDMKNDFVATVTHELRTPLTSIIGFARLNQNKLTRIIEPHLPPENEKVQKAIRQINGNTVIQLKEGDRLFKLINDLLDMLKLESQDQTCTKEWVQLSHIMDESLDSVRPLVDPDLLELRTVLDSEIPDVNADPQRVQQVLVNLLSNAIKFTDRGTVTLAADVVDGEVVVRVSDSGRGIPPEECERVFEKFTQVGDVLVDKPKGNGLGLAICKEIIHQHHGRMWVDSQVGVGSTFAFTLPLNHEV